MVEFTYGGKRYSLGFNRKSAAAIERAGFVKTEIDEKPNFMIPLLVYGSFQMNHRKATDKEIDEIFENMADQDSFVSALLESYNATYETLLGNHVDPEEDGGNFIKWSKT